MPAHSRLTLGGDRALYVGNLPPTGWHGHAAPVLLIGLSGRFALHLVGGRVEHCHSALVDAGVQHLLDPCGEQVALMYLEPDSREARSLRQPFAVHGGVIPDVAIPVRGRSTIEAYLREFDLPALLRLRCDPGRPLDARVQRSLQLLRQPGEARLGREALAAGVQLSASRFNHLFSAEMGVSLRSYRVWSQVRLAMAGLATSPRLTDAALHGAFSDSAHFSRMFRQTFGMTPSSVLRPLKEVVLVR